MRSEPSSTYNHGLFARLVEVEDGSFWFRSRNRLIIWALRSYFPKAKDFLEIGCGTGFVLLGIRNEIPHLSLYGSDIYDEALIYAGERLKGADLFRMDARSLSFEEKFDIIGAFDLLEHIREDDVILSKMFRAVRRGGGIILSVPQHSVMWSQSDEDAHHVRRYAAPELERKVKGAGFKVRDVISFVSLLLPFMFISRLKSRLSCERYDVINELRSNGFMNALLEKVMDLERTLVRLGLRLPFGGSLLLIADKT